MNAYKQYRMSRAKRIWKNILGWVVLISIAYSIADVGGFIAWGVSSQNPPLGWYFGSITEFIINLI